MNTNSKIKFAFFGSSLFSVIILDELEKLGFIPAIIVTTPDKPQGRKLIVTESPVKIWAKKRNTEIYTPAKLNDVFIQSLKTQNCELFIVASYGKIIPENLINLPKFKTLNIHPSLLPKYRGASPLQSVILDDQKKTGVTIMKIDKEMDHGPIIAQKEITIDTWPTYEVLENQMAVEGAKLLAESLPKWINGDLNEIEQDHAQASYTKKIIKENGLLNFNHDQYLNFRKIQAYHEWPQAFFFIKKDEKDIRVKVTSALFIENKLVIKKVIPEGSREMSFEDFVKGYTKIGK